MSKAFLFALTAALNPTLLTRAALFQGRRRGKQVAKRSDETRLDPVEAAEGRTLA